MSYQPWQKGSGTSVDTTSKMNDILGNLQSSLNELATRSNTMEKQITTPRFNPSAPKTTDKPSPFKFTKVTAPTVIFPGDKPKVVTKQDSINNFPPPPVSEKPKTPTFQETTEKPTNFDSRTSFQ